MKKLTALFLLFFASGLLVRAQEPSDALKEVFSDAEYFLSSEFYADALPEYVKIYKRGYADNANINYRIGICYLNIPGNKKEAIPYFQKAVLNVSDQYVEGNLKEKRAPLDAFLYLGNAFRINNELEKAISAYNKYLELLGPKTSEMRTYTEKQIVNCQLAIKMQKEPYPVDFVNLGNKINNASGNYRPAVSGDGQTMAYMNHLKFFDAIYLSRLVNGQWTAPEILNPIVLSDGDQFTSSLSYDGKTLLLTKEDQFNSDIYFSKFVNGTWTPSMPYNKQINTKFWESHACLTKDEKKLYFASNRKDGIGEMDIYYSNLQANGEWGPAVNLGTPINTPLSEDTPFITADGKTIFFSSQGHENMGGFDIFRSSLQADGSWSTPVNLGYPVNTTDDDLFYVPAGDGSSGYMALYEKSGLGDQDIYLLTIHPRPVTEPVKEEPVLVEIKEKGQAVKDTAPAVVETKPVEPLAVVEETPVKKPLQEVKKTEELVQPGKTILQPLLFEFNQTSLSDNTRKTLDLLISALKAFPSVEIEICGHTDSKGSEEYNQTLGMKRAQIVKNHLLARGIAESRISVTSKGESVALAINSNPDGTDNPEGRRLNRRVEFKLSSDANGMILLEPLDIPSDLRIP